MNCPPWSQLTRPLLELADDGQEHRIRAAMEKVADRLGLDDEVLAETLNSGQTRLYNRIGWARTHLAKAELVSQPRRGYFKITEQGRKALRDYAGPFDSPYLNDAFPVFKENWNKGKAAEASGGPTNAKNLGDDNYDTEATPEEELEAAVNQINDSLADEVLAAVKEMSPAFFERLVVKLLVKMGYGGTLADAGRALGKSGDEGVDGVIKEDRLGLDLIYLQAKRYTDTAIGRPAIQAFVGALQGAKARKGVFLTTSTFATTAVDYAASIETKVILIDGAQLARYMIEMGVGVDTTNTYELKKINADFFSEE